MTRWDSRGRSEGRAAFGVVLILIGVLSLLNNLGIIFIPSLWRVFWPVVLIWVGANILRRGSMRHSWHPSSDFAPSSDSKSILNLSAVLGGSNHKSSAQNFAGANLNVFLGGITLDLREAKMEGRSATLEIFATLGSVEIFVPPTWTIESQINPFLSGFENKTHAPKEAEQRLILRGTVAMAGVEVKN